MTVVLPLVEAVSILAFGAMAWQLLRRLPELRRGAPPTHSRISMRDALWCAALGLLSRLALYVASYLLGRALGVVREPFLYAWSHWDARQYLDIARDGYVATGDERLRLVFFPLYPLLIRAATFVFREDHVAALAVSNAMFATSCALLYAWIAMDGDARKARRAVLLLILCPFSFFFCAPFSESLFLCLALGVAVCCRRQHFLFAALLGMLAALTRLLGIVLLGYIALEALLQGGGWRTMGRRLACSAIVSLGTLAYLWINWSLHGDPFRFLAFQRDNWHQSFGLFFQTVSTSVDYLVSGGWETALGTWGPQLVAIALSAGLILYRSRSKRYSELAYSFVYWWVTISPTWLLSGARYLMALFPLYRDAASALESRPMRHIVYAASGALLLAYTLFYLAEGYVM